MPGSWWRSGWARGHSGCERRTACWPSRPRSHPRCSACLRRSRAKRRARPRPHSNQASCCLLFCCPQTARVPRGGSRDTLQGTVTPRSSVACAHCDGGLPVATPGVCLIRRRCWCWCGRAACAARSVHKRSLEGLVLLSGRECHGCVRWTACQRCTAALSTSASAPSPHLGRPLHAARRANEASRRVRAAAARAVLEPLKAAGTRYAHMQCLALGGYKGPLDLCCSVCLPVLAGGRSCCLPSPRQGCISCAGMGSTC